MVETRGEAAPQEPKPNGTPKAFEYWPQRQVCTVREETLTVWRKDLEGKAAVLRGELVKVEGGVVQIDQELARRRAEREEKRGHHASG